MTRYLVLVSKMSGTSLSGRLRSRRRRSSSSSRRCVGGRRKPEMRSSSVASYRAPSVPRHEPRPCTCGRWRGRQSAAVICTAPVACPCTAASAQLLALAAGPMLPSLRVVGTAAAATAMHGHASREELQHWVQHARSPFFRRVAVHMHLQASVLCRRDVRRTQLPSGHFEPRAVPRD